jgi:uncharacterized membrane protein YtjA (UPF0391 family)
MLYWAVVFLIIAVVAAVLGFGGVAVAAAGIAKLLFFIFSLISPGRPSYLSTHTKLPLHTIYQT